MENGNVAGVAGGLSLWQMWRLSQEWMPLVNHGQRFLATTDAHERSLIVAEGFAWVATKTETKVDDEIAADLRELLATPAGERLVRRLVALAERGPA